MFKRSFRQICHVVACNHLVSLISMTLPVAVQLLTSCCLSAGSSTWDAVVVGAAGHVGDSWFGNIPMKLPTLQQMERFKKCGCTQLKNCRSVFDCVCFSWFFSLVVLGCRPADTHDGQDRQDPYIVGATRGPVATWLLLKRRYGNAKETTTLLNLNIQDEGLTRKFRQHGNVAKFQPSTLKRFYFHFLKMFRRRVACLRWCVQTSSVQGWEKI